MRLRLAVWLIRTSMMRVDFEMSGF